VHEHYPDKMLDFLSVVNPNEKNDSQGSPFSFHLKVLQKVIIVLVTDKNPGCKDAATILGVIKLLLTHIPKNEKSGRVVSVKKWLVKLCEEQSLEDLTLVKSVVTFLFSLLRTQEDLEIVSIASFEYFLFLSFLLLF
jgi:hypothetical protein